MKYKIKLTRISVLTFRFDSGLALEQGSRQGFESSSKWTVASDSESSF